MTQRILTVTALASAALTTACQGGVVFSDAFEPVRGRYRARDDALHVYASHARIPMSADTWGPGPDVSQLTVVADGSVSLDPDIEIEREHWGLVEFTLRSGEAGSGTVRLVDDDGEVLARREVEVVDADALAVDVTSPDTVDMALVIDPGQVRIYRGGEAALRVDMTHDGEDIFGLDAVSPLTDAPGVTAQMATGCAHDTCDAQRSAVKIDVASTATDAAEVLLSAGEAALTVTVVPTADSEITSLEVRDGEWDPNPDGNHHAVVAEARAYGERVLGVPVTWRLAGQALEGTGDLLRYEATPGVSVAALAEFGGQSATVAVNASPETAFVSSITDSCASVQPALPLLALVLWSRALKRARHQKSGIARGKPALSA